MSVNITALTSINETNTFQNVTGALLINSDGMFYVFLVLIFMLIVTLRQVRQGYDIFQSLFIALSLSSVPVILLRALEFANTAYMPDWYIALHIVLFAITGLISYWNKQ